MGQCSHEYCSNSQLDHGIGIKQNHKFSHLNYQWEVIYFQHHGLIVHRDLEIGQRSNATTDFLTLISIKIKTLVFQGFMPYNTQYFFI